MRLAPIKLAPIKCSGCSAPLPLGVPQPHVACPYCGDDNALPAEYVEAAQLRSQEADARRQVEPLWRKLAQGAPGWSGVLAILLVVLLPPLATLVGVLLAQLGTAEVVAVISLPALLPGSGLWVWAGAVSATTLRFQASLAAHPSAEAEGAPLCRNCGAPLQPEPDALAATCGYCGADSLLQQIPVKSISRALGEALTTLEQATRRLRGRRAMLGLGAAGVALLIAGSSVLLCLAMLHVM